MNKAIFRTIYNHPSLSVSDLKKLASAHQPVKFSKNDFFLKRGGTANEYYLVEEGLVRSFTYDYQGKDVTTGFIGPNEVLIEVSSLFQRIPAKENLQSLTKGHAWKIDFPVFQQFYHKMPAFNEWGRSWMSAQLFEEKRRSREMITHSATMRYKQLMEEHPEIMQQAPLKHVASYLGITDSSLSRIRKKLSGSR